MNCTTIAAAALCTLLVFSANADSATIAYWPFGNSGFADVSGNGNTLVNEGNATFGVGDHAASGVFVFR